ncbi:MAG: prolyl oligopeptidase family serine peptidase, partial [Gemmatimonadota bacterium]|nr:prolyl oligopeptidase family serine peptidase [Gemmatimonadota bacterium]
SVDGQRLAITRVRPKKTRADLTWFLWDNATADIWVQMRPSDLPANITDGAGDGSGWWSAQWSPDGSKLAMLSTRGGNVHLWTWDASTRQLHQASKSNIDLPKVRERPYVWLDANHLMYPTLSPTEFSQGMVWERRAPMLAAPAWAKFNAGKEATASVLQSGVPPDLEKRPHGKLVSLDLGDGREHEIADAQTSGWVVSPNGRAVAYTRTVTIYTPKTDELLPFGASGLSTIDVATTNGERVAFQGEISRDVIEESLRWSRDGNQLALLGYANGRNAPPLLYLLDVPNRTVTARTLTGLDAAPIVREQAQIEWTDANNLIVLAAKASEGKKDVQARRDWWLIAGDSAARVLTSTMPSVPRELVAQDGRRAFVGIADGEIWRVTPGTSQVENLTKAFGPKVTGLAWPVQTNLGSDEYAYPSRTYSQLVFVVRDSATQSPYVLDLASAQIHEIHKPARDADLVTYSPQSASAVFFESNRNGLHVWRTSVRDGQTTALVSANGFLRDIAEGEFRSIEYTSLDGKKLKAWVILPYGYQAGKRYPVLTWVYAGSVASPRPSPFQSINSSSSLNMQIPAGHGYAVLLPSMPLNPEGAVDDPMLRLPNGVLPAIDKLIELGIADPARVFLMGQSFGGFSTYGLVTQTSRFTAAASLAGLSDLISLYGQFDARLRYAEYPHENLFQASLFESAQVHMGNPPWRDLNRYIRNSPIFFVDRVETPLMIIQGDQDYVAMQQGEEFFMSLYRQGKRASFVRYWGEGHVLASPANIRDMWTRVFAWFEEFSPRETNAPSAARSP